MQIDLSAMKVDSIGIVGNLVFNITPDLEYDRFRARLRRLCDHFLLIASANLYSDLETDLFFLNLARCAENWRRGVVIASKEHKRRISFQYDLPIHAAVVSESITVINALKDALPKEWVENEEYPWRFHINWILLHLASNGISEDDQLKTHLESLESCEVESDTSILIKALLNIDDLGEAEFWESFENLLYRQKETIDQIGEMGTMSIQQFAPIKYCWYEGMAWLKLARKKGFRFPVTAFVLCPEESLILQESQYNGDWAILHDRNI